MAQVVGHASRLLRARKRLCPRCRKPFVTADKTAMLCRKCSNAVQGVREVLEWEREMLDRLEQDPVVIEMRARLRNMLRK